jgi:hypothetical protein
MKDLTLEEMDNLPDDLKLFYTKVSLQNMGFFVAISMTECESMKSKYPEYFTN